MFAFDALVERRIREAMERGEFRDLPASGGRWNWKRYCTPLEARRSAVPHHNGAKKILERLAGAA